MARTITERQAQAMAYHLVDLIETRAHALQKAEPALSFTQAMHRALAEMAQASRHKA